DYYNIHEKRRPDNTNLSGVAHLATINIDASIICKQLINKYQGLFDISYTQHKIQWASTKQSESFKFDRIDQLTEQLLHSMQDYLEILNIILKYNETTNHLNNYIVPVIADWPGQLFIRRAITQLYKNNSKSQILSEVISFVSILAPLHVSLNSREQVIKIYYSFFKKLFHINFNDYWIKNIHNRIRASTTCKDNANDIQKQAYLLEAFTNTKYYLYSSSELDFLTNKICLFLLQQFQVVFEEYQKKLKANATLSITKPKPKSKKDKKDSNIEFITIDHIDEKVLPAGYHTTYLPIFNSCNYCYKSFEQDSDRTILIYGHEYH
ncbi:30046_t:CDS:2, partial [Racocetra persica]